MEVEVAHLIGGNHVQVGVRHLESGDDQADPLCAERAPTSGGHEARHLEASCSDGFIEIRPMVDLGNRHHEAVTLMGRVDAHEHDAHGIAPHEGSRKFAVDDAGEDARHGQSVRSGRGAVWIREHADASSDARHGRPSMFDGLWTIPNLITLLRLACLPLFLWLLFSKDNRRDAAWLLGVLGATDWVDGFLARRLGQTSEFGKVFDPTVDRLLFIVGIIALIIDGSVPIWFALAVGVREVFVGAMMLGATVLFKMERFDVTWWGKTATFLMMFAFPGFLMAESTISIAGFFHVAAWVLDSGTGSQLVHRRCLYSGSTGGRAGWATDRSQAR